MKFKYILKTSLLSFSLIALTSCIGDLDQEPIDPDSFTEIDVYQSIETSKGAFAKLYTGIALSGQQGLAGQADLDVPDEGASQYTRLLFNLQALSTDEAISSWGDGTLQEFVNTNWATDNDYNKMWYDRLGQNVIYCSEFIKNMEKFEGDSEADLMIAEARFLRAYHYYNLIDTYRNVPIQLEISNDAPTQSSAQEVFDFIESELMDLEDILPASNFYGRVDRVAAMALLSRLYLNAETYTGVDRFSDAVAYSKAVIDSQYSLHDSYGELFLSDNHSNGAQNENIFLLNYDGIETTTYGGTTFFIHANFGGSMNADAYGSNGGWGGNTATQNLVSKFESSGTDGEGNPNAWSDGRAMFYTDGQSYLTNEKKFTNGGYAVIKWQNIDSNGDYTAADASKLAADTDLALIRMGEIYLNYAEAVLRGGGGSRAQALAYVNELRERAYGNTSGNIVDGELTLDFLLDERSRELYWEGTRRSDLVRFNSYTSGTYVWPFKGGFVQGSGIDSHRDIMPIPLQILLANSNLRQNPGY